MEFAGLGEDECKSCLKMTFAKNLNALCKANLDHYGHPMGDECLRTIGKTLKVLHDTMGTYSARVGEEFALLWFEKKLENVSKLASQFNSIICDLWGLTILCIQNRMNIIHL